MSQPPWRILIADDDPTAALLFRAALAGDAFLPTVVDNGIDALTAFESQPFDLALLDVEMPGMDGLAVCAAIRQARGEAFPVLLVTGRNDREFVAQAMSLAAGYIRKPLNWSALPDTLRALLA